MKKHQSIFILIILAVIAISILVFFTGQRHNTDIKEDEYVVAEEDFLNENIISTIDASPLSSKEEAGLLLMREEEKLARDVYNALHDRWGLKIFENIAKSEQTHTDSVKGLLDRYDIQDPVKEDIAGYFENNELQSLHDSLVEQGSESLESALTVGATIEDLDIYDLNELLLDVDNKDIQIVYNNLIRGSKNHMRAFIKQLESRGGSYEAQYITNEELNQIISQ